MATPEAPRLPEQGLARVSGKAARGQNGGRMTGLSPVPRRDGARSRRAAPSAGSLSDLGFIRVNGGAYVGTTLTSGLNDVAPKGTPTNTLVDSGAATYNSTSGIFTIARAGLWVVMADLRTSSTPSGYLHLISPRDGFADAGPNVPFLSDGSEIIAAGMTSPAPAGVGSTMGCYALLASGGPTVTSAYVVLYPIAFFD